MSIELSAGQLNELAEQIAKYGIPPDWEAWLLLLSIIVVLTALSAFMGAFFTKRGEIEAMGRSLDSLVKQTESLTVATGTINSNFGRLDWVEQKKWEIKQQFYWSLLPTLHQYTTALKKYVATWKDFESIKADNISDPEAIRARLEACTQQREAAFQQAKEAFAKIDEAQVFVGIFLSADIRDRYRKYLERASSTSDAALGDYWENLRDAALQLRRDIQSAAAEDLQMRLHERPLTVPTSGGAK